MPLTRKELAIIRKQYPAEHFEVKESKGKLEVIPKKAIIRIFARQLKQLKAQTPKEELSEQLLWLMQNKAPNEKDFLQKQITVKKEISDLLTSEAKRCKTRKIIYLQRLLP